MVLPLLHFSFSLVSEKSEKERERFDASPQAERNWREYRKKDPTQELKHAKSKIVSLVCSSKDSNREVVRSIASTVATRGKAMSLSLPSYFASLRNTNGADEILIVPDEARRSPSSSSPLAMTCPPTYPLPCSTSLLSLLAADSSLPRPASSSQLLGQEQVHEEAAIRMRRQDGRGCCRDLHQDISSTVVRIMRTDDHATTTGCQRGDTSSLSNEEITLRTSLNSYYDETEDSDICTPSSQHFLLDDAPNGR